MIKTKLHSNSGMSPEAYTDFVEAAKRTHPLGRAGTPEEVYGKGIMLIKETSQPSPDDPLTWDDYQMLSRKFQNLFYPSSMQDNANKVGAKVQGNVFNVLD